MILPIHHNPNSTSGVLDDQLIESVFLSSEGTIEDKKENRQLVPAIIKTNCRLFPSLFLIKMLSLLNHHQVRYFIYSCSD